MTEQFVFEGFVRASGSSDSFAEFYRNRLRFQKGGRIAATVLREAYAQWAEESGLPVVNGRAVRSFMEANGHPTGKSSSNYYRDVVMGDFEGQPLPNRTFPITDARPMREALAVTVDDLDQMIAELQVMRRRLFRLSAGGKGR